MRRWCTSVVLLALALLPAVLWPAGRASALSCVPIAQQWANYDLVIRGRIAAIAPDQVDFSVTRYYKGDGPPQLTTTVWGAGSGQRMDWEQMPRVGDELVVALRSNAGTLENSACMLWHDVRSPIDGQLQALLGSDRGPAGAAPTPAAAVRIQGGVFVCDGWLWF